MAKISDITVGLQIDIRPFQEAFRQIGIGFNAFSMPYQQIAQYNTQMARWRAFYPEIPAELGLKLIAHTAAQTAAPLSYVAGVLIGPTYRHPRELDGFPPEWTLTHWERQMRQRFGLDNSHGLLYPRLPNLALIRAYERRHRDDHRRRKANPRPRGADRYRPFSVRPTPGDVGQPG